MKTDLKNIKNFLVLYFLLGAAISCKNQNGNNDLKNQMDQLENNDSFAGSEKREDLCQLMTKKDLRAVFELSDSLTLKQKSTKGATCTYEWNDPVSRYLMYSVTLNFARGGKRTRSQIDKVWNAQNNGIYKKHKPETVSGVGDRASWSDLGNGQLRVASGGHIFYVSFFIIPKNKNPMDKQEMIDKASELAKKVIARMR